MAGWLERIQHLIDGEPVDAGATGRPDRQLDQNLQHLKDLLELSLVGQALVARDVTVSPDVLLGQPVFWNATSDRAERALAKVEYDTELGTLVAAAEAEVLGVVLSKSGSTLADIVIVGWVDLDISNAVTGDTEAGRYYLSGSDPGHLTRSRPSLSVPVLFADGHGKALVLPIARNWMEDHGHFRFGLVCAPAGDHTPPSSGNPHTITDADAELAGWLPAAHASFSGNAPAGARFGYNIPAHPALARVWPPLPESSASLTWDRGQNQVGGTEVPLGEHGQAVIDKHGIWWMTNCYSDVPWPTDFTFADGEDSEIIDPPSTCPRPEIMRLSLNFSRTLFDAAQTVVTSLVAKSGGIVRVYGCDGLPSSTGDLTVDALLSLAILNDDEPGFLVIKGIDEDSKFLRGPVVEGVVVAGTGLVATSTGSEVILGTTVHRGRISLTAALTPADKELTPTVVRLSDAKERFENDIPYVGFPAGYVSSVRVSFNVPPDGVSVDCPLTFNLVVLGTQAGQLPNLGVSYRVIPAASGTPQTVPATDTALTPPVTTPLVSANQYLAVAMPAIEVNPGDTVLLEVGRGADGYGGEVGLIRVAAVLGG